MQSACLADMFQLLANDIDAVADDAAVGLDLGLAGSAEKAEAAALAFKVRPGPVQPALLLDEVGELDLQAPFPCARALAENLENESGAVQHLDLPHRLEIALLDGCQRVVDDDE